MKNLKIKIKGMLVVKIAKLRKEIRAYKERVIEDTLKEQEYIDQMNIMQDEIRQLILMLPEKERELWLEKKGKKYERHTSKKKCSKK